MKSVRLKVALIVHLTYSFILLVSMGLIGCGGDSGTENPLISKEAPPEITEDNNPPPAGVPSDSCGGMLALECDVFLAVNQERSLAGVPSLGLNSNCIAEAQSHAQDMALNNYFSHDNPITGETALQRMQRFGVSGGWGENIAVGQRTAASLMNSWMNSSGHRANILRSNFRSMGVGFYNNRWVQCFSSAAPDI